MSKNSKPQPVTMVGGKNVAPQEPAPKKSTKAKTAAPKKTTEPPKEPDPE